MMSKDDMAKSIYSKRYFDLCNARKEVIDRLRAYERKIKKREPGSF